MQAIEARKITPLENTSRAPRLKNCRGKKPSLAMIDAKRGKSAYAVLAARIRIRNVPTISIQNRVPLPPKMCAAMSPRPLPSSGPRYGFSF